MSKVKGDNLGGGIVIFLLAVVLALTVFVAIKQTKNRWYTEDMSNLEFMADLLEEK